ncbi:Putative tail sheat protein [Moritella viscosa]|uniref:Tail sheat protein n=1 Tax=Moritella viscosa TaxID=80854 RepID=A0ABY1HJE7_9GAMM|nr:Putative tail sheat protein [Moritella viscosa]
MTLPVDKDGVTLSTATLKALEKNRLSVPCWYPDYDGIYWADGRMLDVEGGDYQVVENRRVIDKVARRVRLLCIADLGDRSFNSTPFSTKSAQSRYARPLREMSKSTTIGKQMFPGDIQPPSADAITINWVNRNKVKIYIKAKPYDCPKEIVANLMLDLSNPGDAA